jgi:tetraacyldisaccharide 4'-kinase
MKEVLEELERWGADVIFGRARGFRAALMRFSMSALALLFRGMVQFRLWLFRSGWKEEHHLGTQVVSIGNITVGGTGKTPVVELLARSLRDEGRRVAILSRGYKSRKLDFPQKWRDSSGRSIPEEAMPKVVSTGKSLLLSSKYAGDEPYMLARNLEGVSVVVDKDRVKGGRFATRHLEADTLLLDDGMQYLRMARGLNIVLVDAGAPYGTGSLLPRGTLREPPANLHRAHYILLTKCDGSSNDELIENIRKHNRTAGIIECTHGPVHLEDVFSRERRPLSDLAEKWVGAISAIAVPEAFEKSLRKLGAKVEITRRFSDHYRFLRKDVDRFMQRCVERDMEMILTTEKDAVRFPRPKSIDVPILFLRIEVEILKGRDIWQDMISRLVHPNPAAEHVLRNRNAYRI